MSKPDQKWFARWYSPRMVAAELGLSEKTIRRRLADGSIGATRIGGSLRIPATELQRLLETARPLVEATPARVRKPRLRVMKGGQ